GEEGSDPDSPAPKPAKATKKSKPSAPKATPVTKPVVAQQPKPKPAPAKTQEKKRKLSLVDEFIDEEADMQRVVEESLKSVHDAHRGPLPPVVVREPDSRKFQPLPEVQGKGKENVNDEHVSLYLLTLQTPKKVSPVEQYIFQRCTLAPTKPSGHVESPSIYAKLGLASSDTESDEEGSPLVRIGAQDKGQTGPNPGTTVETKSESMVSVTIQQDTSAIPPMTTSVIDLTSRPDSPNVHRPLQASAIKTTTTTTTTHPSPPQLQQRTTDSILIKYIGKLEQIMANLIQDNKHLEERKKKKRHDSPKTPPGSPPHQPPPPPPPAGPSGTSRSPGTFGSSQLPLPPPPLSTSHSDQSKSTAALSSSKTVASDLHMDDDTAPDEQVHSSDDKDIGNAHIPKPNLLGAHHCDHGSLTSLELRTASCDLHELFRSWFPTFVSEESLSFSVAVACSGRCTLGESGLEVRSITGVIIGGIADVSCWIVTDTIDSASVSVVVFSFSTLEGLSLKNRQS
nr:hypothetical protein [Tanacetum cinerariifolium]